MIYESAENMSNSTSSDAVAFFEKEEFDKYEDFSLEFDQECSTLIDLYRPVVSFSFGLKYVTR
jgi:hypothetical protein